MLQSLRNKIHGWPAVLVLGVAVFAMSFFGIEGYFQSHTDTYVAKVGKQEISQDQFQKRLNSLRQQASEQMGDQFDASTYDRPETKQRVLDAMVDQELLLQANKDLGMLVSDQAVRDTIAAIPAFQVNGQFDAGAYRAALAGSQQAPEAFQDDIRSSLAIRLIPDAVDASAIVTEPQVDRFLNLRLQRRDLRFITVPRPALKDAQVSDADIANYYKAHQADFMTPEQVSVKYIEVNGTDLVPDTAPSDDELRKRYADEKQRFIQPEQRLVSHILIDVPKNATPAQQKAALAKAQNIASQATAANFAALASKDSDDLGSKRQGGDLGWLEKGVANAAFDEALFGMQKGQISKPVLSDEGYHVLWLRDVRAGQAKPFEQVRDELVKEAASTGRDRKYNEVAGQLADKTYQNPSSLEPAAQDMKLPIKQTGLFSKEGGQGVAANKKVVAAAFSDDALVQGNNSPLVELGPSHGLILHVDRHLAAAVKPLAQVQSQVRQKILDERVAAAGKKQADDLLARLRKGESMDALGASLKAPVQHQTDAMRVQQGVPEPLLDAAFLAPRPTPAKPSFAEVALPGGAYALVAVDKVQGADLSKVTPAQRDALRQSMQRAYGNAGTTGLIDALKHDTEVKIARDRM